MGYSLRSLLPLSLAVALLTFPCTGRAAHLVVDAESGEVLLAEQASAAWHPASLTKMMTVYLALEALDVGAMELTTTLAVTPRAAAQPPTRIGLDTRDTITVEEAIEAIIVRSANDAAVALAEAMGGTERAFAALMTAKAQELGMAGTVFHNASGLPHPDQVTTARDMAILARAIIRKFPLYYDVFATRWTSFRGRNLPTYNGLLVSYAGADGLKTGFTCASGYNVVISAVRNGRRLIGVVLGAKSGAARTAQMRVLLDNGFRLNPERVDGPELIDVGRDGSPQPTAPPRVLPQDECGRQAEPLVVKGPPGNILGGWGLTLGAFASQKDAQSRAAAARSRLGDTVNGARTTLVEKKVGKLRRYTALLTNLSQSEAANACRLLQRQKTFCVALGPDALKNSRARWW